MDRDAKQKPRSIDSKPIIYDKLQQMKYIYIEQNNNNNNNETEQQKHPL